MKAADTNDNAVTIPRWVAALFAIGVALDILIGIALGGIALQAKHAASSAHISRVASFEACVRANQFRVSDLKRWDEVLALVDTTPHTPAQQAFIAGVRKANQTADTPTDCDHLAP